MSGVGLTGKTVPLNGGNFPVFEDINGQGGLRTVADIATRDGLVTSHALFLKEGMVVYVQSTQCYYGLNADLLTWSFLFPSPALAQQTTWYVDIAAGNDNNTGKIGSPLKTSEELCRRLFPNGQFATFPNANVTVNFAAGAYGALEIYADWTASTPVFGAGLFINCAFTSSAPITLSAVTNTNAATLTRGQVTTASGSFTAKKRIRSTSGAHSGAICYSTGANGGASNHFVSEWFDYNTGLTCTIANGTTCAVDTLAVSFSNVVIHQKGNGYVEVDNAICTKGAECYGNVNSGFINFVGCELGSDLWGYFTVWQSRYTAVWSYTAGFMYVFGSSFQAAGSLFFGHFSVRSGVSVDGTGFTVSGSAFANILGAVEYENGAGTAWALQAGSRTAIGNKQWGASTNYAVGYNLDSGAQVVVGGTNASLAIPATQQIKMTGQNKNYADVPTSFPSTGCIFTINPNPGAVAQSP